MLGSLVLVACLAAAGVVACILFVLFGPVPVNRKVTMVSRIPAPPMPRAAMAVEIAAPIEVAPVAQPSRLATVAALPIEPLKLRRRADATPPRSPQRLARGTQGPDMRDIRPRDFATLEVTAPQMASFEGDEMTFVEDGAN